MRQTTLLLWLLTSLCACSRNAAPEVRPEGYTTARGQQYTVFHPQGLAIGITTSRPDVSDRRMQLSVAAAYTDMDTDQPLGLLVAAGRPVQARATVGFLDGALTIIGDSLAISRLAMGHTPAAAELAHVQQQHGTLLLQELLVFRGRSVHAGGGGHRWVVVESLADTLTLQQFGDDTRELGAVQALNLDMGGWDEGWFRAGPQVVKLGHRRTDTARQSNWLVFAKPAAAGTAP